MKTTCLLVASLASASAFVPAPKAPQTTQLHESLFSKLSNLDLTAIKRGGLCLEQRWVSAKSRQIPPSTALLGNVPRKFCFYATPTSTSAKPSDVDPSLLLPSSNGS